MKPKEVFKNNVLIAEFMGWERHSDFDWKVLEGNDWIIKTRSEGLIFHCSWDWLMPVIAKIKASDEYRDWVDGSGQFEREISVCPGNITHTFEEVCDFLQWLNNRK